jgi:ribosomal protein S18 acetylase RimI-like enzyme
VKGSILKAVAGDLDFLLELMRSYYRDDHLNFDLAQASSTMSRLLAEPQWGSVLLLELERRAIGYVAVCLGFSFELGGNDAFIDEVFVSPEHRGHGYGKQLLEAAAVEAKSLGIRALHLEVDRNNPAARDLYASLGYGLRDRYYLMTKKLAEVDG